MKERLEQIFQNLNQKIMRMGPLNYMYSIFSMYVRSTVCNQHIDEVNTNAIMINHIKARNQL